MRMYRNPELRRFLALLCALGAGAIIACALYPGGAVLWAGLSSLGFVVLLLAYTRRRYLQIDRLSAYLARINRGDDCLDLRDNREGELSILKSEIYKVTVTLREQNELLRREKVAMADALSDISHQIKTPLTAMYMMTDLLCDSRLSQEDRSAFTGRIQVQLNRLQWLVASLLKLSRLDAGTTRLIPTPEPASKLAQDALAPLRIVLEVKEQRLSLSGEDTVVFCDGQWTAEALLNILKNCVEHTPAQGEISLAFSRNPLFTQIRISDTGPGIDPGDLPRIFERFYKGKNASEESAGIGLAMSAAIVKGQGGSIEAFSRPGQGAEFVLRFPNPPADALGR